MKKQILLALAAGALATTTASAQPTNGGMLQLPTGIEALVSIDAHNILIAQTRDTQNPDQRHFARIVPQHIYSGAIARILGGTIIPTEQFLVPGGALGNGNARRGVSSTQVGNNSDNNGFGNNLFGGKMFSNANDYTR